MCGEPVEGIAFFLESLEYDASQVGDENGMVLLYSLCSLNNESFHFTVNAKKAQISGSLVSMSKETCRTAMLDWSPRLMLAIYSCDIQASSQLDSALLRVSSLTPLSFT